MHRDAKEFAKNLEIPVIPGYYGDDQRVEKLVEEIKSIGYPVMLKATMGGGGRVSLVF